VSGDTLGSSSPSLNSAARGAGEDDAASLAEAKALVAVGAGESVVDKGVPGVEGCDGRSGVAGTLFPLPKTLNHPLAASSGPSRKLSSPAEAEAEVEEEEEEGFFAAW